MKERNQRWHQEIDRYTMFLDWKNQYCEIVILLKTIYIFNAILIKLARAFFTWLEKITICIEIQKTLSSQSNLEKEKWSWRNQTPWLQTILQSFSHQMQYGTGKKKPRNIDQWIESPEINPWTYSHLIYDKGGKNIH